MRFKLSTSFGQADDNEEWIRVLKKKLVDSAQAKLIVSQGHRIATILHPSFRSLDMPIITLRDKQRTYDAIRDMLATGSTADSVEEIVDGPSFPGNVRGYQRIHFWTNFCIADGAAANSELDHYFFNL